MSEEHLPEDKNPNEDLSAELNEEVVSVSSDQEEVIDVDDTQDKEEVVQEEELSNEGGEDSTSLDDEVKTESEEETVEEESNATEAKAEEESTPAGGGVMAAAVAAAAVDKEAEVEAPKKEAPIDDGKRWYSLRVISGKERKIKERIELEIQRNNWSAGVSQVLVPSEKVYKIRSGKKVILERNILPGYILIEAHYKKFSPEIVQGIANIPNVIHFLGKTKPIPMQRSEANRMLGKVDESQEVGEALIEPFIVGETVKIIDGPFNGFVGDIKEVNEEKKKLKVIVKIFGRGTEVELNFMQVDKES